MRFAFNFFLHRKLKLISTGNGFLFMSSAFNEYKEKFNTKRSDANPTISRKMAEFFIKSTGEKVNDENQIGGMFMSPQALCGFRQMFMNGMYKWKIGKTGRLKSERACRSKHYDYYKEQYLKFKNAV